MIFLVIRFILPLIGEVTVQTNEMLGNFSARQMSNYIDLINQEENSREHQSILIFKDEKVIQTFRKYEKDNIGLSGNTMWHDQSIKIGNIVYRLYEDSLEVKYIQKKSLKNFLKEIYHVIDRFSEEKKYAKISEEFYDCILFPIFSVYSACFGIFCVHGSLIEMNNGKTIIISGLNGVGKSTLALLLAKKGNKLLSDNIVLFDGSKGLNFNLAMRIERKDYKGEEGIYFNNNIVEILPNISDEGLKKVDKIYNLTRGIDDRLKIIEMNVPCYIWIMYLECAPEIGHANRILSYWLYIYAMSKSQTDTNILVENLVVPDGKLNEAKEFIDNDIKLLN